MNCIIFSKDKIIENIISVDIDAVCRFELTYKKFHIQLAMLGCKNHVRYLENCIQVAYEANKDP